MVFVACVDGSEDALEVVDRAVAHARVWDVGVHVVHVFQPPVSIYALEPNFALDIDDLEEAERASVWARITERLDGSEVPWSRVDRHGYPVSEIISYATEVDADLIIIGTRGRGELASLVLGSTSHGVIQHASCDVLVVRFGADHRRGTKATAS